MEENNRVVEVLETLRTDNVLKTNSAVTQLNQIDRNKYKQLILEAFQEVLKETLANNVFRVEEGIGIEVFNEAIGYIPIVVDVRFKNLDFDLEHESMIYEQKLIAKDEKKAKAKALKAIQIKRDAETRAKKEEARKLEEAKEAVVLVAKQQFSSLGKRKEKELCLL